MSESKRQLKIARQLQKDLSEIIRLKLGGYFKNTLITITRVHVSPDLGIARIYISVMTTDNSQTTIEIITDHKSELRKALGNRIGKQVRRVPELIFIEDYGSRHASEIDHILSNLDIPPQPE
jgi:ribosome-binding factor A